MQLNLKSRSTGRVALTVLLIFSFATAFLTDVHVHVAHANHGHDVHVSVAVDCSSSPVAFIADDDSHSQERSPSQNNLDDSLHGCLALLAPMVVANVLQPARSAKHIVISKRMAHGLPVRLERPPKSVS